MNNKEIKSLLISTFENATPDEFDKIKSDCINNKGIILDFNLNKKKTHKLIKFVSIAASLILIFGITFLILSNHIKEVISIDATASINININEFNKIMSISPNNKEAREIVDNNTISKENVEDTINEIIRILKDENYLTDTNNTVLISTQNINDAENNYSKISKTIKEDTKGETNYILQETEENNELKDKAKSYNTSAGMISFVNNIAENSSYDFNDLISLNINDLLRIVEDNNIYIKDVLFFGKTNNRELIGKDKAETIVLNKLDSKENIKNINTTLSIYEKKLVYITRIGKDNSSSMYIIDAYSGELIDNIEFNGQYINQNNNQNTNNDNGIHQIKDNNNDNDINYQNDDISIKDSNDNDNIEKSEQDDNQQEEIHNKYDNFLFYTKECRYKHQPLIDVAIPYIGESIPYTQSAYYNEYFERDNAVKKEEGIINALICNKDQFYDFFSRYDKKYDESYFLDHAIVALSYKLNNKEAMITDIVKDGTFIYTGYVINESNTGTINEKTLIYEVNKTDIYNVVDIKP